MHDCLFKTKLLPRALTSRNGSPAPSISSSGGIKSHATCPVYTSPGNTKWPAPAACLAKADRNTYTGWSADNQNTYTAWPTHNMYCYPVNPGWLNSSRNLKPTYSNVAPINITLSNPPKNTCDNRITYILIATLVLVALDLVFLR